MIKRDKYKEAFKTKKKITTIIYFTLRLLVIASMVGQSMRGNWNNVFLCLYTLVLFTLPTLISSKFNIELPTLLEIIVYLFIYASEILGEIQNFYGIFTHWDTILHALNGFICAGIGFSLVDILNRNSKKTFHLSPIFLTIVAFCFSMTVGVMWEFFEYTCDKYLEWDMQKDKIVQKISSVKINEKNENKAIIINDIEKTEIYVTNSKEPIIIDGGYLDIGIHDTMKDLFVNFVGAIIFSILGYLYVKGRDEYKIVEKLIPKAKKD